MKSERGFALLAAMWLLVAIATVTLELGIQSRLRYLAAANTLESARARAAAEGGLAATRARLMVLAGRERAVDPWSEVSSLFRDTLRLDEARYHISLRDAGSALHVNKATEVELRRLLVALRVDAGHADRLAQCILDWRDPDDLHRARGAERDAYLREDAPVLPRNAPFEELDELQEVRGITPEIFERVSPYLTLLGTGQVNARTAERPVLLALPGMTEEAVAVLLRDRRARRITSVQDLALRLSPPARAALEADLMPLMARLTFETRELEVTSAAWLDGSPVRAQSEGLLVRSRDAVFLVWRRTT
jgi:general secretion pathway protein K